MGEAKPTPEIYITFPPAGATRTITRGDLVLDFWDGEAKLPDGTEEKLSGRLRGTPFSHVYVTVHSSQIVVVFLDGQGGWTVSANQVQTFVWQPCRKVTIRATQSTNVRVFASSDPRGGPVIADITAPSP